MKQTCLICLLCLLGCKSTGPVGKTVPAAQRDAETPFADVDASRPMKSAGSGGRGGGSGAGSAGTTSGGDAVVNGPGAPQVEFTQPTAASDPDADTVITSNMIAVRCKVTRSRDAVGAEVNKSSVVITLDQPTDATKKISPAINALADDEYEAVFDVGAFPNGPLHFHCEAKDLATRPHVGGAAVDTLLDMGPKIEFFEPKDKGIYTLKTPVVIQFRLMPLPLTDTDTEAVVKEVTLNVAGMDVPVMESTTNAGLFQTSVDFDDRSLFPVPPTAAEIRVFAKNSRTPIAGFRDTKIDVVIDGDGPAIKIESPANGSMQHGEVTIKLTVSDSSGIKPGSLVAKINNDLEIKDWDGTAPNYQQRFDTRHFPSDQVTQLTINVTATDTVGNLSTVSSILRLDNLPPVLSLDPPYIRRHPVNSWVCSMAFDPVGSLAASEGDTVNRSSLYRVLVEDRTNSSPGANAIYHAGVNNGSVVLYAQPRVDVPLLMDTNGDGICDEINDPLNARPVQVKLSGLDPKGSAWYTKSTNLDEALHSGPPECTLPSSDTDPPGPLCPASRDMPLAVHGHIEGKPMAVFALNPTNGSTGECEGTSWELESALGAHEGWVCLAARGEDTIGNIGVSEAMRVCIDDSTTSFVPDCAAEHKPSCVGIIPPATQPCAIVPAQRFLPNLVWPEQP